MKKSLGVSLLLGMLFLSGCAISHTYGPYMGKVVEKDTGEPIEGAVVFMEFYTRLPTPGGPVGYFADATETLTDGEGRFIVPPQWIWTFRPLSYWDQQPSVIIFKPGYGAFPRHKYSTISPQKGDWFPADQHISIQLPRLNSKKERLESLHDAGVWNMDVQCEKQRLILNLYNSESLSLGIEPVMTIKCGDYGHEN